MTSQPIVPLSQASDPFFWGVDLGGTNIKLGVLDNLGATLAFTSIETLESQGPQQAIDRIVAAGRELTRKAGISISQIGRIGLGSPGSMCLQRGMLLEPPNLPHWHQFPIRDALAKATGRPVSFVNDANAAAFGEFWIGAGSAHQSLIMFTLGTGVGGGVIHEGRLINGVNSFGSECGHMIVDSSPEARLCVWGGGRGELEAYASASAVAARARELAEREPSSDLSRRLQEQGRVSAKDVYLSAVGGDGLALRIIDETAHFLGIGIATAVAIVDPGLVVLGGAMDFGGPKCAIGQRFLAATTAEFRKRAFSNVASGTKIEFASLGGDAGYIGAAGIARADNEH
ncbi:MAG: ROK family protein [Pirellulaceae bacterium]|nr:ROK family protein [Pirellulaceae bacterium]